jgi:hypothetical protein
LTTFQHSTSKVERFGLRKTVVRKKPREMSKEGGRECESCQLSGIQLLLSSLSDASAEILLSRYGN